MASNLRKYKYTWKAAASKTVADTPSMSEPIEQTEMDIKAEILSSLKMEIIGLFQTELKSALGEEFGEIKSELQAVKTEIANNTAVLRSNLETINLDSPKRSDSKPQAIIAKLQYYQDCVEILRRAREAGPLQYNEATIFMFPDYPPSIACVRSYVIATEGT